MSGLLQDDFSDTIKVYRIIPRGSIDNCATGDNTFLRLRELFEILSPDDSGAIIETTYLFAQHNPNGRKSVQMYWIDHAHNLETIKAGNHLLKLLE